MSVNTIPDQSEAALLSMRMLGIAYLGSLLRIRIAL